MDDSERSYGYSKDIYHGSRGAGGHYDGPTGDPERSYEYGPEGGFGDSEDTEVSPEEAAIHVEDTGLSRSGGDEREGQYDHDRGSGYAGGESFTWESPDAEEVAAGAGQAGAEKPRQE
jgi:hypothetical protein